MSEELFDVVARPAGNGEADGAAGETIVLRLHVQPGAGRAAVVGRHGNALHIRVAPPPADGRANVAASELVAEILGVKTSQVELVAGEHHRDKRVRVVGVEVGAARDALDEAIEQGHGAGSRGRATHGRR